MEPECAVCVLFQFNSRLGLCWIARKQSLSLLRLQPAASGDSGPPNTAAGLGVPPAIFAILGVDASGCVTTNTSVNAYLRVPIVGETPTGLLAHQFLGGSWYHSRQATLRKQISR